MECAERERLEALLAAIKDRGLRMAMAGEMTEEGIQRLAERQGEAIQALTDHMAEHGCREL